jgi:Sec-independent protein translocase protein TatA
MFNISFFQILIFIFLIFLIFGDFQKLTTNTIKIKEFLLKKKSKENK